MGRGHFHGPARRQLFVGIGHHEPAGIELARGFLDIAFVARVIAVPRDIDPDINRLNNTYVYDIDDLKGVIEENIEDRQKAALRGERLVDEAVIRFRQWYESLDVVPTIVALRRQLEASGVAAPEF